MLDGGARSSALSKKASEKCAATLARCLKILKRRSAPGFTPAATTLAPKCARQFESQFTYAEDLFREVKESDPVREKYPLLFLTARAPGHSELPTKHLPGPGRSQSPPVDRRGSPAEKHPAHSAVHCLPPRAAFLSPGRKGSYGTNDGSHRHQALEGLRNRRRHVRL